MTVPAGHLDDRDLLLKAAAGEPEAVRGLLDQIGPTVYGFVFARVGGDRVAAEDVLQDTLLEVVRSAAGFRGDAALATWACAIARRRVARHWEVERRASIGGTVTPLGSGRVGGDAGGDRDGGGPTTVADPTAAAAFSDLDERDVLIRALGRLPAEHRQVLVLKYLDEEPVAAIAEHLGRSRVSVQSLLQRARVGLREIMEASA